MAGGLNLVELERDVAGDGAVETRLEERGPPGAAGAADAPGVRLAHASHAGEDGLCKSAKIVPLRKC